MAAPYRTTSVFDQDTIPAALRRDHNTKAGVWGLVQVLEGQLLLHYADGTPTRLLGPSCPGPIRPEQVHHVEVTGPVLMQVEFYESDPGADAA